MLLDDSAKSSESRLQFAECIMPLFGAAKSDGMNYEDIYNAIEEKMKIKKESV